MEPTEMEKLYDRYQVVLRDGGCGQDMADFPWLEIECECYSCQLSRDMDDILDAMGVVE